MSPEPNEIIKFHREAFHRCIRNRILYPLLIAAHMQEEGRNHPLFARVEQGSVLFNLHCNLPVVRNYYR